MNRLVHAFNMYMYITLYTTVYRIAGYKINEGENNSVLP